MNINSSSITIIIPAALTVLWLVDTFFNDLYHKLKDLGYIGDKLSQFKIEKVFTEIAILSPKKRMGILSDGNLYKCLKNAEINYETFKQGVLAKL